MRTRASGHMALRAPSYDARGGAAGARRRTRGAAAPRPTARAAPVAPTVRARRQALRVAPEPDPVRLSTSFTDADGRPDRQPADGRVPRAARSTTVEVTSTAGAVAGKVAGRHLDLRPTGSSPARLRHHRLGHPQRRPHRGAHAHASTPSTSRSTSRPTPSIAPLDGETVGRRHAGHRHLRRPGHRPGALREAHAGHRARPRSAGSWHWLSDQRGALPPRVVLEGRHRRLGRRRHQQPPRRQRHLRPGGAQHRLPGRRRPRLQGQRPDPPDAGLLQRRRCCAPSRSPPASPASPPAPAPR